MFIRASIRENVDLHARTLIMEALDGYVRANLAMHRAELARELLSTTHSPARERARPDQ
jgi:hypothetical protein